MQFKIMSPSWKTKDRFLTAILSTAVFGIIAHGYAFSHLTLSHDSLGGFYSTGETKVRLGRFGPLIYKILTDRIMALPWLCGVIGILFIGVSVFLICSMLSLYQRWQIIVSAAVLTTNVTITSLIGTYIQDFEVDTLAILAAAFSAYVWNEIRLKQLGRKFVLFSIMGG